MTVFLIIVIVLGGILTALVCAQTRHTARVANRAAAQALVDAAGTRRTVEETLRRMQQTEAPVTVTQAIRLPPGVVVTAWGDAADYNAGGHIDRGPATQRIPRIGGGTR